MTQAARVVPVAQAVPRYGGCCGDGASPGGSEPAAQAVPEAKAASAVPVRQNNQCQYRRRRRKGGASGSGGISGAGRATSTSGTGSGRSGQGAVASGAGQQLAQAVWRCHRCWWHCHAPALQTIPAERQHTESVGGTGGGAEYGSSAEPPAPAVPAAPGGAERLGWSRNPPVAPVP